MNKLRNAPPAPPAGWMKRSRGTSRRVAGFCHRLARWMAIGAGGCLLIASLVWDQHPATALAHSYTGPARATQDQEPPITPEGPPGVPLTPKQRQELLKSRFEKLKKDATDLAELAKSLQEDINGSNENVLSLKVVDKADKIEKLAHKIKTAAKGE